MRWSGCGLVWMSLWIYVLLCSVKKKVVWVRLAVQRLFLNVCSGEGRRWFMELEKPCGSVLCMCAGIYCWCPGALKYSPNGSTLCAIFMKPSRITIVVFKICSMVIEFIHLPGLLLLQQSHISAAHGLQKIMWQWYHLLTYCWPVWSSGSGISGRWRAFLEPEFA